MSSTSRERVDGRTRTLLLPAMCRKCVVTVLPDRGDFCADGGCYLVNYAGCASCKAFAVQAAPLADDDGASSGSDEESAEVTEFMHRCTACGHDVAQHWHSFDVSTNKDGVEFQDEMMECVLCGKGRDRKRAGIVPPSAAGDAVPGDEEDDGVREPAPEPVTVSTFNADMMAAVQTAAEEDGDEEDEWSA